MSNAYRCVGVAARNRQNGLRPSSLLWPVATRRVPGTMHRQEKRCEGRTPPHRRRPPRPRRRRVGGERPIQLAVAGRPRPHSPSASPDRRLMFGTRGAAGTEKHIGIRNRTFFTSTSWLKYFLDCTFSTTGLLRQNLVVTCTQRSASPVTRSRSRPAAGSVRNAA